MGMFADIGDHDGIDSALVCRAGHVINPHFESRPQFNQKFCEHCGEPTSAACLRCGGRIPGHPQYLSADMDVPPAFCTSCGKPHPWTEARIKAAKELAGEATELTPEERAQLQSSIDDIVVDGPRTELGVSRFKRLTLKAGTEIAGGVRAIITDVLSEVVKKSLGMP
jgi:hypothetical protein